ncbi:MAG TPA: hypothetical protein VFD71_16685 [Planctomycetota bacterium]|nr:hypothetical protein [Planctomycetota bacterium]
MIFRYRSVAIASIALSLLFGASLRAEDDAKKPAERKGPAPREEILKKYDKDHDGKLSDAEKKALQEDNREKAKKRQEELKKQREELIKQYDKDHDGELSNEERKAMRDAMREKAKAKVRAKLKEGDGKEGGEPKPDKPADKPAEKPAEKPASKN